MTSTRVPLTMPDVGLDTPVTVSQWLVRTNKPVFVGERLVELLADGVTIDLPSPATGRLVEIVAGEDDAARPGDVLGWIETDDE